MKSLLLKIILTHVVSVLALPLSTNAGSRPDRQGVNISLTTSGYSFSNAPPNRNVVIHSSRDAGLPDHFSASVTAVNLSSRDIPVTFGSQFQLTKLFVARVLNFKGDVLWRSELATNSLPTVQSVFPKGARLARSFSIPLQISGKRLPAGLYTLETTLGASPIAASTHFEVTGIRAPDLDPNPNPNGFTGIDGNASYIESFTVLSGSEETGAVSFSSGSTQLRKLSIVIYHAGSTVGGEGQPDPIAWTGETGTDGKFLALLNPGLYRVAAVQPVDLVVSSSAHLFTKEVRVELNKLTQVPIGFGAAYYNGELQRTGIRSRVVLTGNGDVTGGIILVFPYNESPVPNALVVVEQQNVATSPFRWEGTADQWGAFKLETPVGTFRVTATGPSNLTAAGKSTVQTLVVADGNYTRDRIAIDRRNQ